MCNVYSVPTSRRRASHSTTQLHWNPAARAGTAVVAQQPPSTLSMSSTTSARLAKKAPASRMSGKLPHSAANFEGSGFQSQCRVYAAGGTQHAGGRYGHLGTPDNHNPSSRPCHGKGLPTGQSPAQVAMPAFRRWRWRAGQSVAPTPSDQARRLQVVRRRLYTGSVTIIHDRFEFE